MASRVWYRLGTSEIVTAFGGKEKDFLSLLLKSTVKLGHIAGVILIRPLGHLHLNV